MGDYQPASRRNERGAVFGAPQTERCGFASSGGVHPDVISYSSMLAAAAAGVCFWLSGRWPWLLVVAPLFCIIRLWFNMLDGMVALASGKASLRGEIVNECPIGLAM